MKRTKDELLEAIRTHGGDSPDDFTISMLEDIADSWSDTPVDTSELDSIKQQLAEMQTEHESLKTTYESLKKSYADRFTLKDDKSDNTSDTSGKSDTTTEETTEDTETYDSIFED